MIKKTLSFRLLFFAVVVFATWQYRLACVLLFVLLNRKWIKSRTLMARHKHSCGIAPDSHLHVERLLDNYHTIIFF